MKKLILILIPGLFLGTGCGVKQTIHGVQTSKTSSHESPFVKVESCSPVLNWQPVTYDQIAKSLSEPATQVQSNSAVDSVAVATISTPPVPAPLILSYDVAIHTALLSKNDRIPPDRGDRVFYVENLPGTSIQITPPLSPKTKYFWSVRVRTSDGRMTPWTTYNKQVNDWWAGYYSSTRNFWFGIKTPSKC